MLNLSGGTAVVTGASSGIGRAIARGLGRLGTSVHLLGSRQEALEALAREMGDAVCHRTELTAESEIRRCAADIAKACDGVDVLVHAAGFIALGRVGEASVEDLDRQYQVNVRAPYLLTQALLPQLRSCAGQVVLLNSSVGLHARAGVGQYAATKHALRGFADSLRDEVNGDGMRVLSVFLGRTATPMQAAIHRMEGKEYDPDRLLQPEDVAAMVLHALRLPRTAEVTDMHIRPLLKPAGPVLP